MLEDPKARTEACSGEHRMHAMDGTSCAFEATAVAHPNIALVKYWGKRSDPQADPQADENLPAVDSVSITLHGLHTRTWVRFDPAYGQDRLWLNGTLASELQMKRVKICLDGVRQRARMALFAHVRSDNNFPTAAGLASSSSGFAALAQAACAALRIPVTLPEVSQLARRGSGSAARSVWGGFVHMRCGHLEDGTDTQAVPILEASAWPLCVLVAVTSWGPKAIGSTEGMRRTCVTSPYEASFRASSQQDVHAALEAIEKRDFKRLGEVAEHSCLKMHGLMLAARPPLLYWESGTVAAMHTVMALRRKGVAVFFTCDAGPQLKAICLPDAREVVQEALKASAGIQDVLSVGLGPGVYVEQGP